MARGGDEQKDLSVRSEEGAGERGGRPPEEEGRRAPSPELRPRRGARREKAEGREGEGEGPEEEAAALLRKIEALFHRLLVAAGASPRGDVPPGLAIEVASGMSPADLLERAERVVTDHLARHDAFQAGRVYCYQCGGALCAHARPASSGEVFAGYGATGRPRWEEFFNYMLALSDNRVDRLFGETPPLLSRVVGRKELTADQLPPYGKTSMTYLILGQVVTGYLHTAGERHALTLQIVETKRRRLRIQLISAEGLREALAEAAEARASPLLRVYDALQEIERRMAAIDLSWQGTRGRRARDALKERIFTALRHFAHSVERKGRQSLRRTSHAERRGRHRPVHMAFDDCLHAGREDFFRDVEKASIVVLGKRGRAHVYTEEGRHVTSFLLDGDQLERRRRRRRYLPLTPEEIERFLTQWRIYRNR